MIRMDVEFKLVDPVNVACGTPCGANCGKNLRTENGTLSRAQIFRNTGDSGVYNFANSYFHRKCLLEKLPQAGEKRSERPESQGSQPNAKKRKNQKNPPTAARSRMPNSSSRNSVEPFQAPRRGAARQPEGVGFRVPSPESLRLESPRPENLLNLRILRNSQEERERLTGVSQDFIHDRQGFSVSRFIANHPLLTAGLVATAAIGIGGIYGSFGTIGTYCIEQNDRVRYCVDNVLQGTIPKEGFIRWVPATFSKWVPSDDLIPKALTQVQSGKEVFFAATSSLFAKNPLSIITGYFN